jgi:hypothetical protein
VSAITLTQLCDEDHNHNFSAERRNSQNRKECWPIRTRKAALWLDAVGTGIAVQQRLMRHTDIRTTMNVYADVVTDEEGQAHSKVVRMGGLAHPFFTHAILRLPAHAFFAKVGVKDAERLPHSYFFWVRSAVTDEHPHPCIKRKGGAASD